MELFNGLKIITAAAAAVAMAVVVENEEGVRGNYRHCFQRQRRKDGGGFVLRYLYMNMKDYFFF